MTASTQLGGDSRAIQQLAKQLARIEARLDDMERGRRLGYSSIEGGALEVNDETGAPVLQVGLQDDGSYAVVGVNGGRVVADVVPQSVIDQIAADLQLADGAVTEAKLAAGAVTETKIADNAVSTPKVVAGAIQALHIAADAVAAGKIAANAITARELSALSVTAGKIAAGTIAADRLTVGAQSAISSRVYDACGDLAPWTQQGGAGTIAVASVSDAVTGGAVFRATGKVGPFVRKGLIPFDPAALYRLRIRTRQTVAPTTGGSQVLAGFAALAGDGVTYVDRDGVTHTTAQTQHWVATTATRTAGEGWQEFTGYLRGTASTGTGSPRPDPNNPGVVNAGARYLQPALYLNYDLGDGTVEVDFVAVDIIPSGAIGAVTIADGAITAPKIAAGAITADKLDANAITGKTITGGMFYTAGALPRVEMGEQIYEGGTKASIRFNQTNKDWDEAVIQVSGAAGAREFTLRGPSAPLGSKGAWIKAREQDYSWEVLCWNDVSGLAGTVTNYIFTPTGMRITQPVSSGAKALEFNHGYSIFADNAGVGGNSTRLWFDGPGGGEVVIGPRSGSVNLGSFRLRCDATTATAGNLNMDANGYVRRSTSALKYKTNIVDADGILDLQLLRQLRPVWFRDRGEVERQGEQAGHHYGLIAEEVHALGLGEFVHYTEDGQPDGVQYDRLVVGLLLLVRDLERRVAQLEAAAA